MGELQAGDVIDGKYRILRMIGEGGMGSVYEGENIKIHRKVAIKSLLAAVAGNADVVGRFEREATAAGRIGNAHILEVLDLGMMADGDRYMVMELLDGEPLSSRIERRGKLTPQEIAPLALQVLEGLGAAHTAGIIHRDLKPDNIFLLKNHVGIKDFVKIIDFGISKFQTLSGDGEAMAMTRTGAVMGTPYYMSPEQASGSREADPRTDLYALGVILYQAVSGQVPFDAPTFNQLLFKIVLSEPPPLKTAVPDIDDAFASIISKSMARDINARFQSSADFIAALEGWRASGASVSVPPPPDRADMEASAIGMQSPKTDRKPHQKTAGSWSTSQAGIPDPQSKKPVIMGLAIAGFLLVSVVSFAAFRIFGNHAPDAAATVPAIQPPAVAVAKAPEPEPARPVVEPAAPAKSSEAPAAASAASPQAAVPAAVGQKFPRRPAAAPAAKPGPVVKEPAKPAPKRKGGDDDDFGY